MKLTWKETSRLESHRQDHRRPVFPLGACVLSLTTLLFLSLTAQASSYAVDKVPNERPKVIPCGTTKQFKVNESAYIESPHFRHGNLLQTNQGSCNWRFLFSGCRLAISCPNFRLNDFLCFDYLEVRSADGKKQRYCGGKGPKNLKLDQETQVTYRTNGVFSSVGFRCRIVCADDTGVNSNDDDSAPIVMAPPIKCLCGVMVPNTKIVNGVETKVNEFKWMAGLVRKNGMTPFCGASLINSRYVLTAAHCVSGRTPLNLEVILNEHNVVLKNETAVPSMRLAVEKIIQHKSYTNRLDYDAALIKLRDGLDDMIEAGTILPVCLPQMDDLRRNYEGEKTTIAGWGVTSEAGTLSPYLQKADVNILPESTCQLSYPGSITSRMLCAAAPQTDACQGDSGGPMIHASPSNIFTQIGVVSWGHGCARPRKPGVYSRITEFMPWILRLTADGSFCSNTLTE